FRRVLFRSARERPLALVEPGMEQALGARVVEHFAPPPQRIAALGLEPRDGGAQVRQHPSTPGGRDAAADLDHADPVKRTLSIHVDRLLLYRVLPRGTLS